MKNAFTLLSLAIGVAGSAFAATAEPHQQGLCEEQAASVTITAPVKEAETVGAYMRWSDARLKSDIVQVGTSPLGIGVYEYTIFGRRELGVLAQEVEKVLPQAVLTTESGYKMVRYDLIPGWDKAVAPHASMQQHSGLQKVLYKIR